MKATIWHNPACGTSRKTLAILEETPGVELTVVEYLKNPYSADKLRQLFRDAAIGARDALRLRGTDAEERGLQDASEDDITAAMAANPAHVARPISDTAKYRKSVASATGTPLLVDLEDPRIINKQIKIT